VLFPEKHGFFFYSRLCSDFQPIAVRSPYLSPLKFVTLLAIIFIGAGEPLFIFLSSPAGGIMARHQEGQGLVEYALIIMLIAIVVIAILSITAEDIVNLYEYIIATMPF
jgi:Flp pilus assembly pilin Flp